MIKKILIILICFSLLAQVALTENKVKIIKISGDVKIRRGVEENWQAAKIGMLLEEIDSILTGETAEVFLQIHDGTTFKLGSYAILNISDLRKISEKELFLYLMSKKINKIEQRNEKTRLRIGNVSVVHGESKAESSGSSNNNSEPNLWIQEVNGAKALHNQKFYPNTIVRLHKILDKYTDIQDCGEIHFYLGKSFEAINKSGQAANAYQLVLNRYSEQTCNNDAAKGRYNEALQAIEGLKRK